jgi:hypothetical protein
MPAQALADHSYLTVASQAVTVLQAAADSADDAYVTGQRWPQEFDHQPTMSIGDVLALLSAEFPAVSISKLRYLEEVGLVTPSRSAGGYRKYSMADAERLRFVLAAQRDHYWPLRVIRQKLEALDLIGGEPPGEVVETRVAGRAGEVTLGEVADLLGVSPDLVQATAAACGAPSDAASAPGALVQAVEAVAELAGHGLQLRHLGAIFQGASRQADIVRGAVAARRQSGSVGRERAAALATDLADCLARLNQAALALALREI